MICLLLQLRDETDGFRAVYGYDADMNEMKRKSHRPAVDLPRQLYNIASCQ